jgi:hypothetical protein
MRSSARLMVILLICTTLSLACVTVNWTTMERLREENYQYRDIAYGNGKMAVSQSNNCVILNNNGSSWYPDMTASSVIPDLQHMPSFFMHITFWNNLFISTSREGIYYSTDCITWVRDSRIQMSILEKPIILSNQIVLCSDQGQILVSKDGLVWQALQDTDISALLGAFPMNGNLALYGAGRVYVLNDTGQYTAVALPYLREKETIKRLRMVGNRYFVLTDSRMLVGSSITDCKDITDSIYYSCNDIKSMVSYLSP